MKIIVPGHRYSINDLKPEHGTISDNQRIQFVCKVGDNFPGNEEQFPGTNCQELLRVLIDRVKYLQGQVWGAENLIIIFLLRLSIWLFEFRAARRKGNLRLFPLRGIETLAANEWDGHIVSKASQSRSTLNKISSGNTPNYVSSRRCNNCRRGSLR